MQTANTEARLTTSLTQWQHCSFSTSSDSFLSGVGKETETGQLAFKLPMASMFYDTIPSWEKQSSIFCATLRKTMMDRKKKTLFLATYFCCFIIFESHLNFFKLKASECFSSCLWTSERELYPLKLELQTGGSCHVGAGTRTQVLWRAASALDCQPLCTPLFIFK